MISRCSLVEYGCQNTSARCSVFNSFETAKQSAFSLALHLLRTVIGFINTDTRCGALGRYSIVWRGQRNSLPGRPEGELVQLQLCVRAFTMSKNLNTG
jgi:hypothetical protein